jgi:hypothetical protein
MTNSIPSSLCLPRLEHRPVALRLAASGSLEARRTMLTTGRRCHDHHRRPLIQIPRSMIRPAFGHVAGHQKARHPSARAIVLGSWRAHQAPFACERYQGRRQRFSPRRCRRLLRHQTNAGSRRQAPGTVRGRCYGAFSVQSGSATTLGSCWASWHGGSRASILPVRVVGPKSLVTR